MNFNNSINILDFDLDLESIKCLTSFIAIRSYKKCIFAAESGHRQSIEGNGL